MANCAISGLIVLTILFGVFVSLPSNILGHGRMIEPPNRSSLWRRPEYDDYHPPINYNDNELFCGGVVVQYEMNGGRCGVCGDAWNETRPRQNEHGGLYGNGVITKRYLAGQELTILVELTFGHLGNFEFRICNLDNNSETDECFEQNLLQMADGSGTKYPIPSTGAAWYKIDTRLPQQLTCSHCVLQWHYLAGNSWGECEDGTWAVGCGPQETFRGCSDIAIDP